MKEGSKGKPLTRPVKLAMIRALSDGVFDEEGRATMLDFFDNKLEIRLIDSRILVPGISQQEFETAVMQIRREQFGNNR